MKRFGNRILASVLATGLVFSVTACGNANSNVNTSEAAGELVNETETDYTTLSDEELNKLYEQEEASKRDIVIPYDGGACISAIPVAQWQGFYEANGLNVKFVSSVDSRDALVAGKVDVAIGMLTDYMTAIQNGLEIQFTSAIHTGCTSAAVLADSEYTGFEKGQRIGIAGAIGSYTQNIALRMVAHDGFTADDFTWVALDSGTILAALQNDDVDVIVGYDQLIFQWEDQGLTKTIRSQTYDDDFKEEACCAIGFSKDFIEKNPVTTYKITKSIKEAALWIEDGDNKEATADYLLENGYTSGTKDYNLKVLNALSFDVPFDKLQKSANDIVDEFVDLGILDANLDKEKFKAGLLVDYNIDNALKKN